MSFQSVAKEIGYNLGFDIVSFSRSDPLHDDQRRYQQWCANGYAAKLYYMLREIPRRWIPQELLPETKSVITFAVNYYSIFPDLPKMGSKKGFGKVARYAWGKDYHKVIQERLEQWVRLFSETISKKIKTKIIVDTAPLLERAFAGKSGAGFIGKNTLLISRKFGSFIFLAEVLTDLELEPDEMSLSQSSHYEGIEKEQEAKSFNRLRMVSPSAEPLSRALVQKDPCGTCKKCITDCPTGALVNSRELDARKCISYWTIEHRGEIPSGMRSEIGDWIFGCDICQEVCPYNGLRPQTKWKEFLPEAGVGYYLSLLEVLSIRTDEEFRLRFSGTPILRAKRNGLVRNACLVAANQNFEEAIPKLAELTERDPDSVIRSHARWALEKMEWVTL